MGPSVILRIGKYEVETAKKSWNAIHINSNSKIGKSINNKFAWYDCDLKECAEGNLTHRCSEFIVGERTLTETPVC